MTEAKIKLDAQGRNGSIVVDGNDIAGGVRALKISAEAGTPAVVELELNHPEIEFEGEARIVLTDGTKDALAKLGWTPPEEEK